MRQERDVRGQILELLQWIKDQGFWPRKFRGNELFVIPVIGKMGRFRDLREHQKASALWVPSVPTLKKVLRRRGMALACRNQNGIYLTGFLHRTQTFSGAGVGRAEALLSAFASMRRMKRIE